MKTSVSQGEELSEIQPARKSTRKRSILIFTVISLLNVGLLALLWTQLLTPAQSSNPQDTTPADPLIGHTAPNFDLAVLNGKPGEQLSLTSLRGKLVVINFWSSTCEPCKDEMPLLETQWERMKSQGVVFVGVDLLDTVEDGNNFLQQHGATYQSVLDSKSETTVSYGVTYTPETMFIDRTGKVVSAVRMEITSQQLQSNLQMLLKTA